MKTNFTSLSSVCLTLISLFISFNLSAQLRVGDPEVVFDQATINANSSCYPQMQRWSEAGVTGGIPFLTDFNKTATIGPGNSNDINAAITAMSNSLSSGQKGLITLTNGNYTINSQILMKSNVSLKGQSRDGVKCNITINAFAGAFLFDNVSYAGIYDMTIQGSWGNPVYNWNYGIGANDELSGNDCTSVWLINGANNCWLDRVNIFNSALHTVWCRGPQNTFRDLDVQGGMRKTGGTYGEGYFYIEGSDNLITGCYITHLRHITIQKHKDSNWDVDYNVFYDNDFDQELSFHTRDDGNNLVENNRITLPIDMPPVAQGDADNVTPSEARTNKPIYFAIMGPWSTNVNHLVSANPNYILNNQCLQQNHNFGSSTPWSQQGNVYYGPIQKGLTNQERIDNFPLVNGSCRNPSGSTLYPVQLNVAPPSCETYGTDVIDSCNPVAWIDGNTYNTSNTTATYTLTNAAGCDSIVSLNLTISSGANSTASLVAIADAYVRGSTYANSNYGTADLVTKFSNNDKWNRKSYIKFDLNGYNAADLVSATLQLNVVGNSVDNTSRKLYSVQDDSWTENGITWNNQPNAASLINDFSAPLTGQSVNIDVTAATNAALADNQIMSLKIEGTNNQFVTFASRENASLSPKLIIVTNGNCDDAPCPDGDNDGVCDANDNTNGNCTLNASCDDGDSCTTNDQYNANCNCAGTYVGDADNDGICNANDNTNGNCTLNASCDDGDACTTGETYDTNCNCSGGSPVGNNSTETLLPTDDTFIRGGTYANSNYGNSTTLHVKKAGNDKWTRSAYLKFNLSSVNGSQLQNATLRVKVSANNDGNVAQELLKAPNDSWTESTLTWNNTQMGGSNISNFTAAAAGQWVEIDVTNVVQAEAAGDNLVSFAITANNNKYIRYHTKESNGNEPQLVLSYQSCNNRIGRIVESRISIYPNPVTDFINIDLQNIVEDTKSNKAVNLKIYTIEGKLMKQQMVTSNTLNRVGVQDLLSNQYYLINIKIEGTKMLSEKFLKL